MMRNMMSKLLKPYYKRYDEKYDEYDEKYEEFYCPTRGTGIIESQNAKFLEFDVADKDCSQHIAPEPTESIEAVRIPISITSESFVPIIEEVVKAPAIVDQEVQNLRRSSRPRRSLLSDNYLVYLDEGNIVDPVTFLEASSCTQSKMWLDAMSEEIKSMSKNDVSFQSFLKYLKYEEIMTSMEFVENNIDHCIYLKISENKFIILTLYVDDILLASNNSGLLHEIKHSLNKMFDMKDLGEASFVLGIEIRRDRSRKLLEFSQKAYIDCILKRSQMKNCKPGDVLMVKGDNLSLDLYPKNDLEKDSIKDVPYPSVVRSLMYAQVCTRPDIAFIVNALGRYQNNPGRSHWVATKKVMRYLKKTRDYILVYKNVDDLEVISYTDSDFARCLDDLRSTSGFIFMFVGGAISWKSVK
ncbi:hypothetical protein FXO38_32441 [Capsicum annuum]|nr:hypothetical protein FXO38_32441 [Capsicum annuum]